MNLNDYLLVKCFKKSQYREKFNSGENIHINSTGHFWNLENSFQQDHEAMIFQQPEKGFFLATKPEFEKLIKESSSFEEIKRKAEDKGLAKVLFETLNVSFRIDGYICCFYLLPKAYVSFRKNIMSITSEKERKDIAYFIEKYINESNDNEFYASVYDANIFCNIFCNGMKNKGYKFITGIVDYKDVDIYQKIKWFQEGNYKSIAFTKPTEYSYQKEFRIFLMKEGEQTGEFISETGIEIYKSLVCGFDYNSLKLKNQNK